MRVDPEDIVRRVEATEDELKGFEEYLASNSYQLMLGRLPSQEERVQYTKWLQATKNNADQLRHVMMAAPEFIERHGYHNPDGLPLFRQKLWLSAISRSFNDLTDEFARWPVAADLYKGVWAVIKL